MDRRSLPVQAVFAAGTLALLAGAAHVVGSDRGPEVVAGPWLQQPTTQSVVVLWETSEPTYGVVRFGRSVPLEREATDGRLDTIHEVLLTGLEPGSIWRYTAESRTTGGRTFATGPHAFATAPDADGPVAFAVVGDTQDQPKVWTRIAAGIQAHRPALLVHCGDLVGNGHEAYRWRDEFFGPARELFRSVPFVAVLGNHEEDAPLFYRYVVNPPPEHRGAVRYGPVELFLIDSERPLDEGGEQHRWLDSALGTSTARWKIVVLHRPPWSSDLDDFGDARVRAAEPGDANARRIIPLLERRRVDVVFCGHVHSYERTWPLFDGRADEVRGVTYVQTGGAGGNREEHAPARSWFTAQVGSEHHYVIVRVLGSTLELDTYDIDGRLRDRWTRHKPRASKAPEEAAR